MRRSLQLCLVVGLRYEVSLKGQASKLDFHLDKTELDFGEVPYTEARRGSCAVAGGWIVGSCWLVEWM